ncbi:MAG: fibronectin type III domain-containing protein [Pseudobdellovibrio sp.]
MKYIGAFLVFILALSINLKSVAADSHATDAVTCSAESKDTTCEDKTAGHHDSSHGSSKDWSHKRHEQVRAILPNKEKQDGTTNVPSKVKLTSPKFLSVVAPAAVKLEWSEVKGATNYHIQVSKDAGFNNRSMYVVEDKNVQGTSFEVKDLEAGVKYFWRVAAVNNSETQTQEFTKSLFSSSAFETKGK